MTNCQLYISAVHTSTNISLQNFFMFGWISWTVQFFRLAVFNPLNWPLPSDRPPCFGHCRHSYRMIFSFSGKTSDKML